MPVSLVSTGITFPDGTTQTTASGGSGSLVAWVNFNGTGTVEIRDSLNVSSITDNGTGKYTINFESALAHENYALVGTTGRVINNTGLSPTTLGLQHTASDITTTECKIQTEISNADTDSAYVMCMVTL